MPASDLGVEDVSVCACVGLICHFVCFNVLMDGENMAYRRDM